MVRSKDLLEGYTAEQRKQLVYSALLELRDWALKGHCKLEPGNEILPLPKRQ